MLHISEKSISEQCLLALVVIFCKELLFVALWPPHIHPMSRAEGLLEGSQCLSHSILTPESYMAPAEIYDL